MNALNCWNDRPPTGLWLFCLLYTPPLQHNKVPKCSGHIHIVNWESGLYKGGGGGALVSRKGIPGSKVYSDKVIQYGELDTLHSKS